MIWSKKKNKKNSQIMKHSSFQKNSQADVVNGIGQNSSPRSTLRKQNHMSKQIHKVLTLGPERICILQGKCFPRGSVSATAYRCFDRVERGRLFPPRAWMEKHVEGFAPAKLWKWSTTCIPVHFANHYLLPWQGFHLMLFSAASIDSRANCSAHICQVGNSPATDVLAAAQWKQDCTRVYKQCWMLHKYVLKVVTPANLCCWWVLIVQKLFFMLFFPPRFLFSTCHSHTWATQL